jgi:dTMP kinase
MTKGAIICFDGPDGVGKTTQLKKVADLLRSQGRQVFTTKAIGGTPLADLLWQALVIDQDRPPETDLHIALASQYSLADDIRARRDRGEIVLIDRSPLSILAYQVFGDGMDKDRAVSAINELLSVMQPNKIVVFEAKEDTLTKLHERYDNPQNDHFEKQPLEYHKRVADGYAEAARQFDAALIDASGTVDEVFARTQLALDDILST